MTHTRLSLAHELFLELADLPGDERKRLLDWHCGEDQELRHEVETLLRSESEMPATFLGGISSGPGDLSPGTEVGAYVIVRLLGEGGMGAVYEARQSAPTRRVALKVIQAARMSRDPLRRFQHEAEVLGNLQHPGIAQIFEAGTARCTLPSGRTREVPFLAMELVRGTPLRDHADAAQLTLRERLELVARTCDAVHHAHQRGIIHRDLKSENVLVDPSHSADGQKIGQPKILDFGIARMIDAEQRTRLTEMGEVVGTLSTMSPEQVSGESGLDVRTDVYSLGVLLYELLTGRPPIDVTGCSLPEAMRRISRQDPIPLRDRDPALRGDVSVIASKALHKDKGRRYQSASDLAEDLRRCLQGAPIQARADSTWYVLQRTLLQHRGYTLGAFSFLLLFLAFVLVTGLQSESNRRLAGQESAARIQAERQLTLSNIERGRLFAEYHNGLGEELIWREYLRDPASRHAYWALWEFYSHNPCVATRLVHSNRARQAEVSPSGDWFATADHAGEVIIWDASARELQRVPAQDAAIRGLSAGPDGRSLAISTIDGTVLAWDVVSRSIRWKTKLAGVGKEGTTQSAGGRSLCFHPTLDLLVTTGAFENVEVLDARTGDLAQTLAHPGATWSVAFSQDGARLAATGSPQVNIWSVPSFDLIATLPGHGAKTFAATFLLDGSTVITGGSDRRLTTWDLASGRPTRDVRPGNGWIRRLTTPGHGDTIVSNGLYRAEVLGLPKLETIASIPFFDSATAGCAAFPEDPLVVTTADSGTVRLWETTPRPGRQIFSGHRGPVRAAVSSDGSHLATADDVGTIRLWHLASGELLRTVETGAGAVRSIAFRPGCLQVVATDPSGNLRWIDLDSGQERGSLAGGLDTSNRSFDFSPDGESIVVACPDHTFRIWRLSSQVSVGEISVVPYQALAVSFSPDGRRIATVSRRKPTLPAQPWAHRADLWESDGTHIASEESDCPWWSIDFAPDGSTLVGGTWDWRVALWNWQDDTLHTLEGHEGTVWDVRSLPAPLGLVASTSADGTLRLWDPATLRNVLRLRIFDRKDAISLDASDDGTILAIAGESSEVIAWDMTHFQRHIAGNLEAMLDRLGPSIDEEVPVTELEQVVAEAMAKPWPRLQR